MHRPSVLLILSVTLLLPIYVQAGKYNPTLDIGDPAPAWNDLAGVDGENHGLSDWKEHDVVVLFFTCNSCPYATEYEVRIKTLAAKYSSESVAFVGVNVNLVEEDSFSEMQKRAKEQAFNFSYLFDPSQQIARDYGATYTPEFFVLNKKRQIAYMGGLDDNSDPKRVKSHYLDDAITALLAGAEPKVSETVAIGCRIRMKRQRRSR